MLRSNKYVIKDLDWDTDFFKVKSARIYLEKKISLEDIMDIKKYVEENKYEFVTIENTNNDDENNRIIQNFERAFLTDVNIQYIKKVDFVKKYKANSYIKIENNFEENKEIVDIAEKAFMYSRFKNDDHLSENRNEVYREWTKNAFNKPYKYFCYFIKDSKIIGYILFSIKEDNESIFLELIAVNKEFKGQGIGQQLIEQLEKFAVENKIKNINVGTQLNNIKAQNFYEKNGFKHIANHSIYHWWL